MKRHLFIILLMSVLSFIGLAGANSDGTRVSLSIQTKTGTVLILAEVADTPEKKELGLMFRESLPKDEGMLFVFDDENRRIFWMKNTPIALDLLFLNADKEIVYIEEGTKPFSLEKITPNVTSQYVLEVNKGFCNLKGVRVGDRVTMR